MRNTNFFTEQPTAAKALAGLTSVATAAVAWAALAPAAPAPAVVTEVAANRSGVAAFACPGDDRVAAKVYADDDIEAIGRNARGTWIQIDPRDEGDPVWIAPGTVFDLPHGLPVVECTADQPTEPGETEAGDTEGDDESADAPDVSTASPDAEPVIDDDPDGPPMDVIDDDPVIPLGPGSPSGSGPAPNRPERPTETPRPAPAGDTTAPVVGSATSDQVVVYGADYSCGQSTAMITVDVVDDTGVSAVRGSSSLGQLTFSATGGSWATTFGPFHDLAAGYDETVRIAVTAVDAAGNEASGHVDVRVIDRCLIR